MHNSAAVVNKWYTVDRSFTITDCDPTLPPHLSHSIGRSLWQASPTIEPKMRPLLERAWDAGRADEIVNFGDIIADVHIIAQDERLLVTFEFVTVRNLRETLERFADRIDEQLQPTPEARPATAPKLRLVTQALTTALLRVAG